MTVRWRLAAAATCLRATKSPARCPVRAAGVVSVNTFFWKILVTRVKRVVDLALKHYVSPISVPRRFA